MACCGNCAKGKTCCGSKSSGLGHYGKSCCGNCATGKPCCGSKTLKGFSAAKKAVGPFLLGIIAYKMFS